MKTFCCILSSLLVTSHSWSSNNDDEPTFSPRKQGQVAYVSSTGRLSTDPAFTFDTEEMALNMDKFSANTFSGDSINFRGREIRNAALVDSSIEGLKHLTVDTLALRSQAARGKGQGLAVINSDGVVSRTGHLRWDDTDKSLKVTSLDSPTGTLAITSDIDLNSNTLNNAKLSPGTVLDDLVFRNGRIENTELHNVKASGLTLGDVTMDSLALTELSSKPKGAMLVVGKDGAVESSSVLKQESEDLLLVSSQVSFTKPIDLNDQIITNGKLISGSIEGPIDITADFISAKHITIRDIQEDKTVTSDRLAVLGLNGKLQMSSIKVDSDGSLGDLNIKGAIDFAHKNSDSRGRVINADIVGGSISEAEKLQVNGNADLSAGLHVAGETYIDGSLTVSGSVLGSGPYVDVSDRRFKRNIEKIGSADALNKIIQLEGVSYDLDFLELLSLDPFNGTVIDAGNRTRQLGFIAQDVEKVLPELVYNDEEGWKGLHYSRLAPVLVESLKQITAELDDLKMVVAGLVQELNRTRN